MNFELFSDMSSDMQKVSGEILLYSEKMGKIIVFGFAHSAKHTFNNNKTKNIICVFIIYAN